MCNKESDLHCNLGLLGKASAETVLGGLINLGLDIRNCRGQDYHGAAAVSGHMIEYLHKKLTVKQHIPTAIVTTLI